eukprot:2533659-Karenia_brevis.AAC.1
MMMMKVMMKLVMQRLFPAHTHARSCAPNDYATAPPCDFVHHPSTPHPLATSNEQTHAHARARYHNDDDDEDDDNAEDDD